MFESQSSSLTSQNVLRSHLLEFLHGGSAHADPRTALADLPPAHYGLRPAEAPHSPWELLEHLRFTLHDLLDFCRNPDYVAPEWPDDYWPGSTPPADKQAWLAAVEEFMGDLAAFERMVEDPETDLESKIPWGQGQTILREVLLAIDHTSYHLGQLVLVRKQLADWKN